MIPWYSIASHVSLEERRAREKEASLDFGVSWYKVGAQNTSYKGEKTSQFFRGEITPGKPIDFSAFL